MRRSLERHMDSCKRRSRVIAVAASLVCPQAFAETPPTGVPAGEPSTQAADPVGIGMAAGAIDAGVLILWRIWQRRNPPK